MINRLAKSLFGSRMREIDRMCNHPAEAQSCQFSGLMNRLVNTHFGSEHLLKPNISYSYFASKVPIRGYEELLPYIDLIRKGGKSILWPEKTIYFAKSSGTTSNVSKYIPITPSSLHGCHQRGNKDVLGLYLNLKPQTRVFKGKTLILGGSKALLPEMNGISTGDLSAILLSTVPYPLRCFKTPPPNIALIPEFERKIEKITRRAIKENVISFAGIPSWNYVMMKHILAHTGKNNLFEIWPQIESFVHGGVSFSPYRELYRQILPSDNFTYMETYNASEGFFAIQDDLSRDDMLLMLDYGIFYEFIPLESLDDPTTAVPLEGVCTEVNYALVITTNGGLVRYLVGDTVRFTSLRPHRIKITGRTKLFINAFGEELVLENADKAITEACIMTGALVSEYTVAPRYMTSDTTGCHEWLIEFEKPPADPLAFDRILDQRVQEANSDYKAKRHKDLTLLPPVIHHARKGLFYDWMKRQNKVGGQNKVPRLSNNRNILETLLDMNHLIQP